MRCLGRARLAFTDSSLTTRVMHGHHGTSGAMSRLLHHDLFDYTSGRWPLLESILPHVLLAGVPERLQNYVQQAPSRRLDGPLVFDAEDKRGTRKLNELQEKSDGAFEVWQNIFGLQPDGWVPAQDYEEAVALCTQAKEEALAEATSEEERAEIMAHWPWDDMGEGKCM
ncbi:hypothetical protein IEO21_09299 [Rhodonia placenta]|uniref:Uncharacterized protein n=1 Tax=Rhodonia placenta TaxID=104341 RepID=A0A8H7TYC8_9APHY|nr:hypothetical protein IEO21_09299 [Postia placenta]